MTVVYDLECVTASIHTYAHKHASEDALHADYSLRLIFQPDADIHQLNNRITTILQNKLELELDRLDFSDPDTPLVSTQHDPNQVTAHITVCPEDDITIPHIADHTSNAIEQTDTELDVKNIDSVEFDTALENNFSY